MPVLLDTGALELLRRRDLRVETIVLKNYPPVLCPHVAGEYIHNQLTAGVSKVALGQARTFVAAFESLAPTTRTADHYAELRFRLLAERVALAEPCCWIAAHALEHNLPLVTTDRAFRQLPDIKTHLILQKRRLPLPAPLENDKAMEVMTHLAKAPAAKARQKQTGGARGGSKSSSASALVFFALNLAQDCLAESSALLENLGEIACGFY